jgi:hypothetical protein
MRGLHDLGILGFIGNTQRQIVLLDRDKLASLDLQYCAPARANSACWPITAFFISVSVRQMSFCMAAVM